MAVLIAENITSRFLNIISLLNSKIPLIAIQLNAIQVDNLPALIFTLVLDLRLGFALDEEELEVTDRSYWEKRSSKATVYMANEWIRTLKTLDQGLEQKYNKFYIGVAKYGKHFNFVIFHP